MYIQHKLIDTHEAEKMKDVNTNAEKLEMTEKEKLAGKPIEITAVESIPSSYGDVGIYSGKLGDGTIVHFFGSSVLDKQEIKVGDKLLLVQIDNVAKTKKYWIAQSVQ